MGSPSSRQSLSNSSKTSTTSRPVRLLLRLRRLEINPDPLDSPATMFVRSVATAFGFGGGNSDAENSGLNSAYCIVPASQRSVGCLESSQLVRQTDLVTHNVASYILLLIYEIRRYQNIQTIDELLRTTLMSTYCPEREVRSPNPSKSIRCPFEVLQGSTHRLASGEKQWDFVVEEAHLGLDLDFDGSSGFDILMQVSSYHEMSLQPKLPFPSS
jgi:hypothetical protein